MNCQYGLCENEAIATFLYSIRREGDNHIVYFRDAWLCEKCVKEHQKNGFMVRKLK